ncbi:uncharacterized protein LOC117955920 isoform X2 [Lates japonicus]
MDLARRYMWVWVIVGVIFVSVVISLIFLLINKCISRGGKHRISQLERGSLFTVKSNTYQERNLDDNSPPLPPRTQFLTAEAQSYENLAEVPEHEENIEDCEQATDGHGPDDYEEALPAYEEPLPEYEEALPEYEEAVDQQPDYVKIEEEEMILPPPPSYNKTDPADDNVSTEDYDDIGGEEENQGEEDYDDVG